MKLRHVLILTALLMILLLSTVQASASSTVSTSTSGQVKIAVKINPHYFNIVITDQKVINQMKNYIESSNNTKKAELELLDTTLKTVVATPEMFVPEQILFTGSSVVLEYTYNPKYVYESNTRLLLPEIQFKYVVPVSVSKTFISNCDLYGNAQSGTCKYELTNKKYSNITLTSKLPRIEYYKERINLTPNNAYVFVDSSGNVLIVFPSNFNIVVNGTCTASKVSNGSTTYFMYTCHKVNYVDFSKLIPDKYKVYIVYNPDNTGVFKIDNLNYKIVTYIRPNVKIEEKTLVANALNRLYFEVINGEKESSGHSSTVKYIIISAVVAGSIVAGIVIYRRRGGEEEDIFE